ncbi:MAG: Ig-like domain-containing protein [Treponema sp.]|nr:Ig-like domain-containing protein [Treponema sp.]
MTYTANSGYHFAEFDAITSNGITATCAEDDTTVTVSGTPTANASITIPDAVVSTGAVTGVTLDKTTTQTITVGENVSFSATVAPSNATDKTVKWSVSGTGITLYSDSECTSEIATDATSTLTVYAKGMETGSATVTVTSNADSSKTASCVTVTTPEYYDKLTQIEDVWTEQAYKLKRFGRGYETYNSSLTAAQAYALATYQAAIDGRPVYVIMSSQNNGYNIHYAVSTDASATENTADIYDICSESNTVRMYYVAQ